MPNLRKNALDSPKMTIDSRKIDFPKFVIVLKFNLEKLSFWVLIDVLTIKGCLGRLKAKKVDFQKTSGENILQ